MPVGLLVLNDSGIVQIDDTEAFCMGIVASGTASATTQVVNAEAVLTVDINYNGEAPLIALAPPAPLSGGVLATLYNGTTWTFRVAMCPNTGGPGGGNASTPFQYYIFDRVKPKTSTAGLEVYDATGKLTFSSSSKILNVLAGENQSTGTTNIAFIVNANIISSSESPTDEQGNVITIWRTDFTGGTIVGDKVVYRSNIVGGNQFNGGGGGPQSPGGISGWGNLSELLVIDKTGI